jgi:hypothetical protein
MSGMTGADTVEVEMLVLVDANGDWDCGADEEQVAERYAERVGDVPAVNRVLRVKLTLPRPKPLEIAVAVELCDEAAPVAVKVA